MPFNALSMLPDDLKTQIRDALVDFVAETAQKYAGDEVARRIEQLRSDSAFTRRFEQGLQKAAQRFLDEYEIEDEDIVSLLISDEGFFKNKAVQKALLSIVKNPTGYSSNERKILEQKFAEILPGRKNRHRVNKAISYYLKCVAREVWSLPELRPVYGLLFQSIAAGAALSQVEIQKAQLQQLTDINFSIRKALLEFVDKLTQSLMQPPRYESNNPSSSVKHNVPQPDYVRFIGRLEEIRQIQRILRPYPDSRAHLISIDGIGGIGKTSLAKEVAHRYIWNIERIPEKERFQFIVWVSAKQTELEPSGIERRFPVFNTLEDITMAISNVLGRGDVAQAKDDERLTLVRTILSQYRTLLIVDNLETVEDERVIAFLRELPAPTKAIVTTRHHIETAYPIHLSGMKRDESFRLMEQESERKGVHLSESDKNILWERTAGVPLAIVWSISLISMGKDKKSVLEDLLSAESDIAKFCFENSLTSIRSRPDADRVLMALSFFPSSANIEALVHIIGAPSPRLVEENLRVLEGYSLVNRLGNNRYNMLPMTRSYVKSISRGSEWTNTFADRWVEWLIRWGERYGIYLDLNINNRTMIEMELENSIAALEWCYESRKWEKYVKIAEGIFDYMLMTNLFQSLQVIIERLEEIYVKYEIYSARSLFMIGYYYWYQEDYEKALPYLEKVLSVTSEKQDTRIYAETIDCQAHYLSRYSDHIDRARRIAASLLDIARETKDSYVEFLGHYRLARIYEKEGRFQLAVNSLQKAKEITSQEGWDRLLAWVLYYEGRSSKNVAEALNAFKRSRDIAEMIKERRLVELAAQRISELSGEK